MKACSCVACANKKWLLVPVKSLLFCLLPDFDADNVHVIIGV